ncbi:hypothetical protein Glove_456g30 [Diversispora epigaea]|uniref:Uncharacterized protein n=1 Tax=Diversispora epigaea TaxID=1348612 RepID=A0A397GXT8_9GLOM|nr:hypothetical protein Glove_456g30 [Diversispora epigaea]
MAKHFTSTYVKPEYPVLSIFLTSKVLKNLKITIKTTSTTTNAIEKPSGGDPTNYCSIIIYNDLLFLEKPQLKPLLLLPTLPSGGDPINYCSIIIYNDLLFLELLRNSAAVIRPITILSCNATSSYGDITIGTIL